MIKEKNRYTYVHIMFVIFVLIFKFIFIYLLHVLYLKLRVFLERKFQHKSVLKEVVSFIYSIDMLHPKLVFAIIILILLHVCHLFIFNECLQSC